MTPLIEGRQLRKTFASVVALDDISFDLHAGEVHALIGENGAGKSTLVRILSGEIGDYEGTVAAAGQPVRFQSPRDALAAGIAVIHQELHVVASLSVAENISLGSEPCGAPLAIDRRVLDRVARDALDAIGADHIPVRALLGTLSPPDRQLVAIARALSLNARCLFMDEPTAALGRREGERLERVIRQLASRGAGIVYISHRLDEVLRIADRVTVLRDGTHVRTLPAAGLTEPEMVRLMCGRAIVRDTIIPVATGAPPVLEVEHLSVRAASESGGAPAHDVSFSVRRGEIVGLAGLVGAGRSDLLRALVGEHAGRMSGSIRVDGKPFAPASPADALAAGVVLLPEERKSDGLLPHQSVGTNITISALQRVSPRGWLRRGLERTEAARLMRDTGVRATGPDASITALSGGNQQKALLARALFASPRVLLLDEPTRGIDLAAKAEIFAEMRALAARGVAIVLCSSELSELLTHCHRVVVVRGGAISATFDRDDATEEKVLTAATGGEPARSGHGDPPRPPWRTRLAAHAAWFGLALVLVLAVATSPVRRGELIFLDPGNLSDILRQVSEKGILAVGMTAVIISGGIDLSVGSVLAFAATLSALLWMRDGVGLLASLVIVIAAGAVWGLVNGLVVARGRLPAFIATLATMSAARGAARYLSGGTAIPLGFGVGGAPSGVRAIAGPLAPNLPAPALIFGLAALAVAFYLAQTRSGRYVYAIGDNEAAARLAGVRVARHKTAVYVLCGALAGLAGLLHAAQLEQGNPNDGVAYELDAIAAIVIGGTTLSGGTGGVGGTIVGILIIGIINNAMGLNNVDANLQLVLKGLIILVAVWLQRRKPSR